MGTGFLDNAKGNNCVLVVENEYIDTFVERGQKLEASLDDVAQIVGSPVEILFMTTSEMKLQVLKIQSAPEVVGAVFCVERNKDKSRKFALVRGRNFGEAEICAEVLKKAVEVELRADVIGGTKAISSSNCKLMREKYLNSYSKVESLYEREQRTEDKFLSSDKRAALNQWENHETSEKMRDGVSRQISHKSSEHMNEKTSKQINERTSKRQSYGCFIEENFIQERNNLVELGLKLQKKSLVQGTWGNLSVRVCGDLMLCTPSGISYDKLRAEDMVLVNILTDRSLMTRESSEGVKATSESVLHTEIYRRRKDVNAIIHTHSKYACVFAAAEKGFPDGKINVSDYAPAGSRQLANNVADALDDSEGAIMAHHGMVAVGTDLFDAFEKAVEVEKEAEKLLGELGND